MENICRCFNLSWLSYSYKLIKMLSVSVWMLTKVAQIVTAAAHRDLYSCMHRPAYEP